MWFQAVCDASQLFGCRNVPSTPNMVPTLRYLGSPKGSKSVSQSGLSPNSYGLYLKIIPSLRCLGFGRAPEAGATVD